MKKLVFWLTRFFMIIAAASMVIVPVACAAPSPSPTPSQSPAATQPVTKPPVITPAASSPAATTKPVTTSPTPAATGPSISITSPQPFVLQQTGDIKVSVKVDNFRLVDKQGQPAVAGEGHIHYFLDVDVPVAPGVPATDVGRFNTSSNITFTWLAVPIGTRYFAVELVNNDDTPLSTPAEDSILVIVRPSPTGPGITDVINPVRDSSLSFNYNAGTKQATLGVHAIRFNIVNKIGQPNVPGEGHYIFYHDTGAPIEPGQPALTANGTYAIAASDFYIWNNIEPGPHTFLAQLVNNDNTPLVPSVVYKTAVNAQALGGPAASTPTITPFVGTPITPLVPPTTTPTPIISPIVSSPRPATAPNIQIQSPSAFMVYPTGDITITVNVQNFKLVDKIGQAPVAGEGHIDYYMDVDIPLEPHTATIPLPFGSHFATTSTSFTWKNVPIGTRQFAVQLVNNDHTPLATAAIDALVLTVVPSQTGPGLTDATNAVLDGTDGALQSFLYNPTLKQATVAVSARNFTIKPITGQTSLPNVPGQGHFVYYIDVDALTTAGKTALTGDGMSVASSDNFHLWNNVQLGLHTFSIQLVNIDNTPLNPPVVYKMVVNTQTAITGGTATP